MQSEQAARDALEPHADGVPFEELARDFLEYRRWTGDDPLLLVAEAAAASTGQRFVDGIKPAVERFRDAFVAADRVTSFASLAALDVEDEDLVAAFGAERKRRVLCEIAHIFADSSIDDDLHALVDWAQSADHYRYVDDPIGAVSGVGPATFQYLRQLAGVPTVAPDPTIERLLLAVDDDLDASPIETTTDLRTIASCEWLAFISDFSPLELDCIAWWTATDPDERDAVLEAVRDA
ncbi:hypothetical protein [Natrinema halophilum]|uniref:DNA-3-methyladenine glycosylase 2 family protein n=1 Tax=Natrinema halophilum TaxID=1699371 RepID=A0A7D5K825_9EURY|nr:hypothetical protein [Natrinema halophilum]QLG50443.1 hypothetical protein HYG82_17110 [Natrinema halophilum]